MTKGLSTSTSFHMVVMSVVFVKALHNNPKLEQHKHAYQYSATRRTTLGKEVLYFLTVTTEFSAVVSQLRNLNNCP